MPPQAGATELQHRSMVTSERVDVEDSGGKRKRSRKPVSCAECRRLKLKCDRQVPCSTCAKRGCAALCPNGVLAAGPGNKFVLADTQQLHEKIAAMAKRIFELEEALAELQSQTSSATHPLLSDERLSVKAPLSTQSALATFDDTTDALGTLTLGERPLFFGPHAILYYILMGRDTEETPPATFGLPVNIALLASALPMALTGSARAELYARLVDRLPSADQAWNLVELCYSRNAWFCMLISKDELRDTIFSRVYASSGPTFTQLAAHELAILFMILATACMTDSNRSPSTPDSSNYYLLAKVALELDSVIDHPTIQAISALYMMALYVHIADPPNSETSCYILMGLTARLCQSLGLHRDDTNWNLCHSERQKRRRVFWEVAAYDAWTSLGYGRPPSFTMAHMDARVADDRDGFMDENGRWQASFCHWYHNFAANVLYKVMDHAFGVVPLSYATVLRLDQLVREHPVDDSLQIVHGKPEDPAMSTSIFIQRNSVLCLTQRLLLFLHRSFFARALIQHRDDPLNSKYAQSVLTVFRAAVQINACVRAFHLRVPEALVIGHWAPGCGLAPPALAELDDMCQVLETVSEKSDRIMRMMPSIRTLHSTAHGSYAAFTSSPGATQLRESNQVDEVMQMDQWFLWGPTRIVDKTSPAPSRAACSSSSSSVLPSGISFTPLKSSTSSNSASSVTGPSTCPSAASTWPSSDPLNHVPAGNGSSGQSSDTASTTARDSALLTQQQDAQMQGVFPVPLVPPPYGAEVPLGLECLISNDSANPLDTLATAQHHEQVPNYDKALAWIASEMGTLPGISPPREHDLAWQQFVGDIGIFGQGPQ